MKPHVLFITLAALLCFSSFAFAVGNETVSVLRKGADQDTGYKWAVIRMANSRLHGRRVNQMNKADEFMREFCGSRMEPRITRTEAVPGSMQRTFQCEPAEEIPAPVLK